MRDPASIALRAISIIALTFTALSVAGRAGAEPTEEQVAAIKANCRSDYMSYCWSVPRGGPEAAQCLKQNLAKLSPGCAQAVKAATAAAAAPPPAKPASAPATEAQSSPTATAKPTAPAALEASPSTEAAATPQTAPASQPASPPKAAETSAKPAAPAQSAVGTSPAPALAKAQPPAATEQPAAASPPTPPSAEAVASEGAPVIIGSIPPRKKLMVFSNCKQDLNTYCADVAYGEGRQLHCLFANKAALTPNCQGALARLAR
jgi:hypothetical protein